jgi:hypothetical protein
MRLERTGRLDELHEAVRREGAMVIADNHRRSDMIEEKRMWQAR